MSAPVHGAERIRELSEHRDAIIYTVYPLERSQNAAVKVIIYEQ